MRGIMSQVVKKVAIEIIDGNILALCVFTDHMKGILIGMISHSWKHPFISGSQHRANSVWAAQAASMPPCHEAM